MPLEPLALFAIPWPPCLLNLSASGIIFDFRACAHTIGQCSADACSFGWLQLGARLAISKVHHRPPPSTLAIHPPRLNSVVRHMGLSAMRAHKPRSLQEPSRARKLLHARALQSTSSQAQAAGSLSACEAYVNKALGSTNVDRRKLLAHLPRLILDVAGALHSLPVLGDKTLGPFGQCKALR